MHRKNSLLCKPSVGKQEEQMDYIGPASKTVNLLFCRRLPSL